MTDKRRRCLEAAIAATNTNNTAALDKLDEWLSSASREKASRYIGDLSLLGEEGKTAAFAAMTRVKLKREARVLATYYGLRGSRIHEIAPGDLSKAKPDALLFMCTTTTDPTIAEYFKSNYAAASNEWWKTLQFCMAGICSAYNGNVTLDKVKQHINQAIAGRLFLSNDRAKEPIDIQIQDLDKAGIVASDIITYLSEGYQSVFLRHIRFKLDADGWLERES